MNMNAASLPVTECVSVAASGLRPAAGTEAQSPTVTMTAFKFNTQQLDSDGPSRSTELIMILSRFPGPACAKTRDIQIVNPGRVSRS
jgi:hypothetical protein